MECNKTWAILACPRSGTHYTSEFFGRAGFLFRHERMGPNGGCGWTLLLETFPPEVCILHQVRSPQQSIHRMGGSWDKKTDALMTSVLGEWETPPFGISRGIEYWVKWNKICEERSLMTFRVEDLNPGTEVLQKICDIIGIPMFEAPNLPKNISTRGVRIEVTKAMAMEAAPKFAEEAFVLADNYGYEWD